MSTEFFKDTVTTAAPLTVPISMKPQHTGFQIVAFGANNLQIEVRRNSTSSYISLTTISGEPLVVDMVQLSDVRLTATGGDVDFELQLLQDRVSLPGAQNWNR